MSHLSVIAKNFHDKTFGEMIQGLRTSKGISARQLSSDIDASPSYISKVESGNLVPTLERFAKIAEALGISDQEIVFLVRMCSQ